jgi:hypothetical protein
MDLLFNQVEIFYTNFLAETSYHLLASIYYKNSLKLSVPSNQILSLATIETRQCWAL